MAYEFDAATVAAKAVMKHSQFSTVSTPVAQEFAAESWLIVKRVHLPDDLQEMGCVLYTAHLLYDFEFGGLASGQNQSVEVGQIKKSTTGGNFQVYGKYDKDPFYRDWLDLVRRYGKGWGLGLAVVK